MNFELALDCPENKKVMIIASKRFRIPDLDKQQCRLLGLWDAVELYNPSRGVPFKLFLSLRVKFRCLKWCHENYDPRIKYVDSQNIHWSASESNNRGESFQLGSGINKKSNQIENSCILAKSFAFSLSEKSIKKSNNSEFLTDVMLSCSKEEKELLTLRFIENRTLEDIGIKYNVTYETIRKRINIILERFKD